MEMEFSAGFVPFRQSLDFHFNVCDRYISLSIALSLSVLGSASCLFNLINWRSVSHKFAHFKNAQKTLNSPVVVRAIDRYDTCGQQQGLDCAGLPWPGLAAVPWPVHVAHTSQHLGKWKEIAVDSIRLQLLFSSAQFWPGLGFVPMRYTFYMQQFACGARALHQHAQAEKGRGREIDGGMCIHISIHILWTGCNWQHTSMQ